ncbi:hypothetical protein AB840_10235 [Megasphaera cerevisiae DSM 20462]|uniref:DUF4127 domain-containing protein n=2 Tax=Megasphaera TaxID=906 RepID=A0A0J6ZMD7_9FIRM|nr:DUF4127 family protein [Megasphaera cerevisiae]KMO86046.1 hypothetical protein AB840_10235 [Megasphaera cerevisiae DSM 20462]OKY52467.1 hypothetical protein BSR42_12680 [Megasphaera cerevisiae]SKA03964.1 Ribosome recycling factor [Megasphaera cerevisiae DSM 20462]
MKILRNIVGMLVVSALTCIGPSALAKTILYVPQDNRPVDFAYTVGTAQDAGYTVITPPEKILSGAQFQGSPDKLAEWVANNAGQADAMVLSVDSLVYGGLVDSRKHNLSMDTLVQRLKRVEELHQKYKNIPIYAFSTVMRSPWAGGKGVEPDYYLTFGTDMYQLASLQAKMDTERLNPQERDNWFAIMRRVPMEYLQDWYNRRHKNMMINYRLIQDAKNGTFKYFSLGHDDNSVNTQSSLESKYLEMSGAEIPKTVFGSFPGADQLGLLLITRASNDFNNYHPKVTIIYPLGGGEKTVPSYDGQAVGKTIAAHVEAIGGTITNTERPDLLLAVNTPLTTSTSESGNFENFPIMLQSTQEFLTQIEKAVNDGIPVSIVDMAFSNGSDNTLVYGLYRDKMLYRLAAYNGWNTASNSVGYGISQGVLSKYMTADAHANMLTTQYLDNWAYQANVRDYIYRMQQKIEAGTVKKYYPTVMTELQSRTKEQIQRYAATYLGVNPKTVNVTLPWNRLFEVYVDVRPTADVSLESDVRQKIKNKELKRLAAQVEEAQKNFDEAKKKAKDGNIDPDTAQQLQNAIQAATDQYNAEQQAQDLSRKEEMAQQNRTWAPGK